MFPFTDRHDNRPTEKCHIVPIQRDRNMRGPHQNDLRELWSLFDFTSPGIPGTLPAFEAEFAEPIKRFTYT